MKAALAVLLLAAMVLACSQSRKSEPKTLTSEHRDAIRASLKSRGIPNPASLELNDVGFLVATYELQKQPSNVRGFAESALLAIREAMLPFKAVENYRVTVNGPSPGTGMIRRYGSARMIGGVVEWESGLSY